MTNNLNFSNPIEVENGDLGSLLGLDFTPPIESDKDQIQDLDKKDKDTDEDTKQDQNQNQDQNDQDGDSKDLKGGIDLSLTTDSDSDYDTDVEIPPIARTINLLHEQGFITDKYEGFDEETEYTDETLAKLLDFNWNKKLDEEIISFVDGFSDTTKKIINFDLAAKGKDVDSYIKTLLEEQNIRSLDPKNEYDQEKILRQYMQKEGFSTADIDERITDFKESGLLEKEAVRLKPKLDEAAAKIAEQKQKEQVQIRQLEETRNEEFKKRIVGTLQKGEVSGIQLTKEEAGSLYSVLTNDNVEIKMPDGSKVSMPALEAILFYNKYDSKGSLDNVILATLLLTNPKKFEEEYAKRATTKVTNTFIKETKYNNAIKTGKNTDAPKGTPPKKDEPWRLKFKS